MATTTELLQGTLDLLILKAVSLRPEHGYGILLRIQQISREALQIQQGSLYPALYRLEKRGLIEAEWGYSETKRRVKFYHLTDEGRSELHVETDRWANFSKAVGTIMLASGEPSRG